MFDSYNQFWVLTVVYRNNAKINHCMILETIKYVNDPFLELKLLLRKKKIKRKITPKKNKLREKFKLDSPLSSGISKTKSSNKPNDRTKVLFIKLDIYSPINKEHGC